METTKYVRMLRILILSSAMSAILSVLSNKFFESTATTYLLFILAVIMTLISLLYLMLSARTKQVRIPKGFYLDCTSNKNFYWLVCRECGTEFPGEFGEKSKTAAIKEILTKYSEVLKNHGKNCAKLDWKKMP